MKTVRLAMVLINGLSRYARWGTMKSMETTPERITERLHTLHRQEEEERTKKLAARLALPYLDLDVSPLDREALGFLPYDTARTAEVIALRKLGKTLTLGLVNPETPRARELFKKLVGDGYRLRTVLVSPRSLARALAVYKELPPPDRKEITGAVAVDEGRIERLAKELTTFGAVKEKLVSLFTQNTSALLEFLLAGALNLEASDLHLEMGERHGNARLRIDGLLHDLGQLPLALARALTGRIKLLSGLKLNITKKPQDGRFSLTYGDAAVELRASVIPGEYGEDVVLRLLNPRTIALALEELGLRPDLYSTIAAIIRQPHGLVIATGPTGSGKTTALYAFVRDLATPEIKIITIEDPIEYHLDGITQTQVDERRGYTFSMALRSVLRQDPDVILVGEIRDRETAETALAASLTGHMVFTTLHANDAAGAIPRLLDLDVNPQTVAPALSLALAQRLVRKLCPTCKTAYPASSREADLLKKALGSLPDTLVAEPLKKPLTLYKASGCAECLGGYKGRIGVFEGLVVDEAMERFILESPPPSALRERAVRAGMIGLNQDALLKALAGITTVQEVERVVGTSE